MWYAGENRILSPPLAVKRNSPLIHHCSEHRAGRVTGIRAGFLFAGPPAEQTASTGTSIPRGGVACRGKGIVLQFRRSRFMTASASIGTFRRQIIFVKYSLHMRPASKRMSSLAMTEPLQGEGFQQRPNSEQPNIPSGVMQAVLIHALQLRRNCREVFLLCDIQGHCVSEAAMILGISPAAAQRRLQLARRRMDAVIERLCRGSEEAGQPESE